MLLTQLLLLHCSCAEGIMKIKDSDLFTCNEARILLTKDRGKNILCLSNHYSLIIYIVQYMYISVTCYLIYMYMYTYLCLIDCSTMYLVK